MEESQKLACSECGAEFETEGQGGGVCVLCLQPYCRDHMAPPKEGVGPLCQSCSGGS